jgi:hypothetical protein
LNNFTSRIIKGFKNLVQNINLNSFASRISAMKRTTIQTLIFSTNLIKSSTLNRIIPQNINLTNFASRLRIWVRNSLQNLSINNLTNRITKSFKSLSQNIYIGNFGVGIHNIVIYQISLFQNIIFNSSQTIWCYMKLGGNCGTIIPVIPTITNIFCALLKDIGNNNYICITNNGYYVLNLPALSSETTNLAIPGIGMSVFAMCAGSILIMRRRKKPSENLNIKEGE